MTSTTYPLHNPTTYRAVRPSDLARHLRALKRSSATHAAPLTAPAAPPAPTQGVRNAARLVSNTSAVVALMATVTLTILAVSAYAKAQGAVWPWFAVWAVAVISLIAVSGLREQFAHHVLRGLVHLHERRVAARNERVIAEAIRRDPRLRLELQIIQARSERDAMLAHLPH